MPRPKNKLAHATSTRLAPDAQQRTALGATANRYAGAAAFNDYTSRKARNTVRAQAADLQSFADYLHEIGDHAELSGLDLQTTPAVWQGITWGIIEGYLRWLLQEGYSISSINRKLSTTKVYAKLAGKAGLIGPDELALIKNVTGYSRKEGKRLDAVRPANRVGAKKARHVSITPQQARTLKQQPPTPQGRRDTLLVCLLLDHGLRVGEVAGLRCADVDLARGLLTFYRSKVDRQQAHRLTQDTQYALEQWFNSGHAPLAEGPLLRASLKNGELGKAGLSQRAITARIRTLGEEVGLFGLSAHDCRHYWATTAARSGTDPFALRDAGGWNSLAMPSRYVEEQAIANDGVKLDG